MEASVWPSYGISHCVRGVGRKPKGGKERRGGQEWEKEKEEKASEWEWERWRKEEVPWSLLHSMYDFTATLEKNVFFFCPPFLEWDREKGDVGSGEGGTGGRLFPEMNLPVAIWVTSQL